MEDQTNDLVPDEGGDDLIDEAMLGMGDFLLQMADLDGHLFDGEMHTAMRLERVHMSMPVQLDLHVRDDGSVLFGSSPPLYYTETTFAPVFHQLTINIDIEEKQNHDNDGVGK